MKIRLVTDGGFYCPDLVGKVVEAEDNLYVTHAELCRVSDVWAELIAKEDAVRGETTAPDYLWCFTRHEVEILE